MYWSTNKTVLELLAATERTLDYNWCELWNLIFAPALYYEDASQEKANGELNFEDDEEPQLQDMVRMVRIAMSHLDRLPEGSALYLRQLQFVERSMPNLPPEIADIYRSFREAHSSEVMYQ